MNLKEFVEALVRAADRDAADNEPKRSALLRRPPVAGERTRWPYDEDTDCCGSFEARSDAENRAV